MKGGKLFPKQQTEEEKAEVEAAKAKKPAAPAKAGQPVAVDPAAIQQMQEAINTRNEQNNQLKLEWDQLANNTKFTRYCENQYREPMIKFLKENVTETNEATNVQTIQLREGALRAFESAVCDGEKGCWITLEKLVPKEEEPPAGSAKKPAAPAKGKGPSTADELKPFFAKAWLDLRPFLHPGAKTFH